MLVSRVPGFHNLRQKDPREKITRQLVHWQEYQSNFWGNKEFFCLAKRTRELYVFISKSHGIKFFYPFFGARITIIEQPTELLGISSVNTPK